LRGSGIGSRRVPDPALVCPGDSLLDLAAAAAPFVPYVRYRAASASER